MRQYKIRFGLGAEQCSKLVYENIESLTIFIHVSTTTLTNNFHPKCLAIILDKHNFQI